MEAQFGLFIDEQRCSKADFKWELSHFSSDSQDDLTLLRSLSSHSYRSVYSSQWQFFFFLAGRSHPVSFPEQM